MLHYELPDGRPHSYEAVSRKGAADFEAQLRQLGKHEPPREDAVAMVPILPDGSVLLIREFRYPLNSWCVSFPAGLVDERRCSKQQGASCLRKRVIGHVLI